MKGETYPAGREFGQYSLLEILGRGGMGAVYRARDNVRQREVALKLLNPEIAHDDVYRERFTRESLAASQLTEPHVVPIHDWGEIDGVLYIDMRLIAADNLRDLIADRHLIDVESAASIVTQVAYALDAAHNAGIVHRDVKPDNILVTQKGFAYLVDFGIAYSGHLSQLTNADSVIGSLCYIAPELLDGQVPSVRSDVYALGCVLYESLVGTTPFNGATPTQIMAAHMSSDRPSLRKARESGKITDVRLDGIVRRALALEPAARFSSVGEFAATLRDVLNADPTATFAGVSNTFGADLSTQPETVRTQLAWRQPSPNRIGEPAPYPRVADKPRRRSPLVPLAICATIVVLALIGGGVFYSLTGKSESAPTGALPTTPTPSTSIASTTVPSVTVDTPLPGDLAAMQRRFVNTCSPRVGTANESTSCGWALNVAQLVDRHKPDPVIQGVAYSPAVSSGQPNRDPNVPTDCRRRVGYYECSGGDRGHVFVIE